MSEATDSSIRWHSLPDWFRRLATQERGSVLLETAKFDAENFRTLLFRNPIDELAAKTVEDVLNILDQIDHHVEEGRYVAGFVSYECGEVFQNFSTFSETTRSPTPLIRMGVFNTPLTFDHRYGTIDGTIPSRSFEAGNDDSSEAQVEDVSLHISEQEYAEKISEIHEYLAAGHSYQVNFTDRVTGMFAGSRMALYRGLLQCQPVSYAAFMNYGEYQILSFSPELFYRTKNGRVTVRPMKGTWPRGVRLEDDEQAAQSLRNDEKNRAEHVMIVDLLRNDVGKVSELGSVKVDTFMQVESYRTLHQLTSTISGTLATNRRPTQILQSLFPSGSITGAPKRRTMEIIRELEQSPRGVYTGAIGWMGPHDQSCFNVAIRTLLLEGKRFTMGVGGGIVVDSDAIAEYQECQLKASFVKRLGTSFQLFETMLADGRVIELLESHLKRLRKSAAYFQIPLDESQLREELFRVLFANTHTKTRVRLSLDEHGQFQISASPLDVTKWSGRIFLASHRTDPSNVFLHHKTTNRLQYNLALEEARRNGFDEVLFVNELGMVTEGAISNIFLSLGGFIVTPDESSGLLPGVFRRSILDRSAAIENRPISLQELLRAEHIWYCNALRGCRTVQTIMDQQDRVLWVQSAAKLPDHWTDLELGK